MLLLIVVSLSIIAQINRSGLKAAWQEYLRSSVLRFQVLVLTVGPLLPVVDIFDDRAAELAWIFFLVPLFLGIFSLSRIGAAGSSGRAISLGIGRRLIPVLGGSLFLFFFLCVPSFFCLKK